MEIFISWSGPKSQALASALHGWLPKIVNAFKPWLSSSDLDKGTRWGSEVAARLKQSRAGIICLTPGNLHSDWILFEAGALSKQVEHTFVCPLLIGLEPTDLKGPLAQFQATRVNKLETLHLLKTLNKAAAEEAMPDAHINEVFEMWWPTLETELKKLPDETQEAAARPKRSERDLLEEILNLVRSQTREAPALQPRAIVDFITDIVHSRDADGILPNITDSSVSTPEGGDYFVHLKTDDGNMYAFKVPSNISSDRVREFILSRLSILIDSKPRRTA